MMDEHKIEENLLKLREQLFVNHELKRELKKSFVRKKRKKWRSYSVIIGIAVATLLITIFQFRFETTIVNASSLKIASAVSFLDIGRGEVGEFAHKDGMLYITSKQHGMVSTNEEKVTEISSEKMDEFDISEDGQTVLYTNDGSIYVYNTESNERKVLIKNTESIRYAHPLWVDKKEFIVTKLEQGEKKLVRIDLDSKGETFITTGEHASYHKDKNILIFERDDKVILRDLKKKTDMVIDTGKQPAVSKDGSYITYIKDTNKIADVWIADTDSETKKQVTFNSMLSSVGVYEYSSPTWSSTNLELYVIKNISGDDDSERIMKISLQEEPPTARETLESYLQALIVRDDDYAKSLMVNPPDYLTYSNPYVVGFTILGSKTEGNSIYMEAEINRTDTATAYYRTSRYEFEMTKGREGYVINNVKEITNTEITTLSPETGKDTGIVTLVEGGTRGDLFSLEDIPNEYMENKKIRISSLVYHPGTQLIVFGLQEMENSNGKNSVALLRYDRNTQRFTLLNKIDMNKDLTIAGLALDASGESLAVNFSTSTKDYVEVYNVKTNRLVQSIDDARIVNWKGKTLMYEKQFNNHIIMNTLEIE
ncbi:hypothetical protein ACLM5H_22145 [Fredinandcohnia humi]